MGLVDRDCRFMRANPKLVQISGVDSTEIVGLSISEVWPALSATVLASIAYLTLLGRIGASRAGYATVMFPLVALAISSVAEGYQWTWIAAVGACLALAGNWLVLTKR